MSTNSSINGTPMTLEFQIPGSLSTFMSTIIIPFESEIPPLPSPPVLSLEDLLNESSVIAQKEANDKQAILRFFDRGIDTIRPKLLEWAKAGLPSAFPIDTIEIIPPPRCSDGVSRDFLGYIQYVSEMLLPDLLLITQVKLSNIILLYSYSFNKLTLHCSTS